MMLRSFLRFFGYAIKKLIGLFAMVIASVYLIILIANYGGYLDRIKKGLILEQIGGMVYGGWLEDTPEPERTRIIDETRRKMEAAEGLDKPFLARTLLWLNDGLTLNMDEASGYWGLGSGVGGDLRAFLLKSTPPTLLLFGLSTLIIFLVSVPFGVYLSRSYGSRMDRWIRSLSVLSVIPAWLYGFILLIAVSLLSLPVETIWLLFLAIFINAFFQSTYSWRTFFLLYHDEDYIELARAIGLPDRVIDRRYLLRPALPTLLTNFTLMLIGAWMGSIILEVRFDWRGIGYLMYDAMRSSNILLMVGVTSIYAYLLALTVFLLDIIIAIIDPRWKLGEGSALASGRPVILERAVSEARLRRSNRLEPVLHTKSERVSASKYFRDTLTGLRDGMLGFVTGIRAAYRKVTLVPSARRSLKFLGALSAASALIVVFIPYNLAIGLWRGDGNIFYRYPQNAQPAWVNLIRKDDLPPNIILDSHKGDAEKTVESLSDEMRKINIHFRFDYPYTTYPQDMALYIKAEYEQKLPLVNLTWRWPDGRELKLGQFQTTSARIFALSHDGELQRKLKARVLHKVLLGSKDIQDGPGPGDLPLQGTYELELEAYTFEPESGLDAEFVLRGQVYGVAGTDYARRDLLVELLWGLPIALVFGLAGALGTAFLTLGIAAISAWYGGWLDGLVQRLTELNMSLPAYPISLMIFVLYSKSVWVILTVWILLSIFSVSLRTYRATFLQVKESPYIDAARSYGASSLRIILLYMIPRTVPTLVPQIISLVPSYVFLEAALAYLEVSDPVFPTWGKLMVDAMSNPNYPSYWALVPGVLLVLLGLSFVSIGSALENVLNPRLMEE